MIEQYWSINSDAFSIFVHSTKFPFLRDIVLMNFFSTIIFDTVPYMFV